MKSTKPEKKPKESKSDKKNLALALLAVACISALSVIATKSILIEDVKSYETGINVDNIAGFNVSSSEHFLQFGTSMPGSIVSRELIFNNTDAGQRKVIIKSYGEMKEWIVVSENNFILESNESKTIKINVVVPGYAEYGKHSGELKIVFIKKTFGF